MGGRRGERGSVELTSDQVCTCLTGAPRAHDHGC